MSAYFIHSSKFIEADGRLIAFQRHFFKGGKRMQTVVGFCFFADIDHLFYKTEIGMCDNCSGGTEYRAITIFTDGNIIYLVWQYISLYRCEKNTDYRTVIVIDGNRKYKYQFFIQPRYNRLFDEVFALRGKLKIGSVGNIDDFSRICVPPPFHIA